MAVVSPPSPLSLVYFFSTSPADISSLPSSSASTSSTPDTSTSQWHRLRETCSILRMRLDLMGD